MCTCVSVCACVSECDYTYLKSYIFHFGLSTVCDVLVDDDDDDVEKEEEQEATHSSWSVASAPLGAEAFKRFDIPPEVKAATL